MRQSCREMRTMGLRNPPARAYSRRPCSSLSWPRPKPRPASAQNPPAPADSTTAQTLRSWFSEPTVEAEAIPIPQIFVDAIQRQWATLTSGSGPAY